ncbi:MAG TPA: HEAT repeat domain-containing protein [Planctomycetota bacterium]
MRFRMLLLIPLFCLPTFAQQQIMGKDVNAWIEHLKTHENEDERKLAMFCLQDFGPAASAAVPELITLLGEELQTTTPRWAAETLAAIGTEAKSALPQLLSILADPRRAPTQRTAACAALPQIDPESPAVRKAVLLALRDNSAEVRAAAMQGAVTIAPFEPSVLATLSKMLLSGQDEHATALALRCMGQAGIEPLAKAVERGEGAARTEAAAALASMGSEANATLSVLMKTAKRERNAQTRGALLLAAVRVAPKDAEVLQTAVEQLAFDPALRTPENVVAGTRLLLSAGPAALPAMRAGLRANDPAVRREIVGMLAKLPNPGPDVVGDLIGRVQDQDAEVRRAAIKALDSLGPTAAAAKDALLNAAKSDAALARAAELAALNVSRDPQRPRLRSLLEAKPDAEVLAALKNDDAAIRAEAAEALRTRTDGKETVASALIGALADKEAAVRVAAARSLARFGDFSRTALPTFVQWIDGEDAAQQQAALVALAGMAAEAKPALPAIVKRALSPAYDSDPELREMLSITLRLVGTDAVPALVAELKNEDPVARARAARTIASMSAVGATAVPDLIELSKSAVDSDAQAALTALGAIGPAAFPMAKGHLAGTLLTDLFADRRKWAALAIGEMGIPKDVDAKHVFDALQAALLDPDESVCRAAHGALVRIGDPALPRLRELLKLGEGQASYWWAVRTLARLKSDADDVIPRLLEVTQPGVIQIKQGAFAERGSAAELLGNYAPQHTELIPEMVKLLSDRDDIVSRAATRTLVKFGEAAVEPIAKLLQDRRPLTRQRAMEALDAVRKKLETPPDNAGAPEIMK